MPVEVACQATSFNRQADLVSTTSEQVRGWYLPLGERYDAWPMDPEGFSTFGRLCQLIIRADREVANDCVIPWPGRERVRVKSGMSPECSTAGGCSLWCGGRTGLIIELRSEELARRVRRYGVLPVLAESRKP